MLYLRSLKSESFWEKKRQTDKEHESRYYVEYQRKEKERMAVQTMINDGASSITDGTGSRKYGAMSELETDTLGASSTCDQSTNDPLSKRPSENLNEKFDMLRPTTHENKNGPHLLPVFRCRNQLIEKIEAYPVTVVSGTTGCGKSTQIPQFILDHHAATDRFVNIIVTQPRRLAAQAVAKRVCNERNWHLGRLVGYKVGLDKSNASKDTRLLYVTTGILIKMLINRKSMAQWTHIIIDEVHERDKDMDFLLLLTRKFITSNSQGVKIVLMSATLNADKLLRYYSWPMYLNGPNFQQGTKFEIPGSTVHDISVYYLNEILEGRQTTFKGPTEKPILAESCILECRRIIYEGFKRLEKNSRQEVKGAVLIFLPGELEISTVIKTFTKFDPDNQEKLVLLPLHSRLPFESAQKIFDPVEHSYRKVILSTNMAESSVTIPDISYVIDFCLSKKMICDASTNYAALQLVWADKNSCDQRKGRAGRVKSGRVYRLVFQDFYDNVIPDEHEPDMRCAPLDKVILDTKLLDMGSPKELLALALDPPELGNIKT